MMDCMPKPPFEVAVDFYNIGADQVNVWDSCNRRKGRNRDARGPQIVSESTGEATKVKARTVMNIIHYPTPQAYWTTFTAMDKTFIKHYG